MQQSCLYSPFMKVVYCWMNREWKLFMLLRKLEHHSSTHWKEQAGHWKEQALCYGSLWLMASMTRTHSLIMTVIYVKRWLQLSVNHLASIHMKLRLNTKMEHRDLTLCEKHYWLRLFEQQSDFPAASISILSIGGMVVVLDDDTVICVMKLNISCFYSGGSSHVCQLLIGSMD